MAVMFELVVIIGLILSYIIDIKLGFALTAIIFILSIDTPHPKDKPPP